MSKQPIKRTCGTNDVHYRLLATDPNYADNRAAIETRIWRRRLGLGRMTGRNRITTIPTVVHVIYNRTEQNISDDQVHSQIHVLNQDYRARNEDKTTIPVVFEPYIGDMRLEFELAQTDPQGNITTGITRTHTDVQSFTADDRMKFIDTGGAAA